jgi:hypothetical protein
MSRAKDPFAGIQGVRIDRHGRLIAVEEREHFYVCPACGQAVDKRDLGEVFHHEEPSHERLPENA